MQQETSHGIILVTLPMRSSYQLQWKTINIQSFSMVLKGFFYTRKAISLTSQERLRRTCVLRWNYTNVKLAYALQNGLGAEL